MEDNSFTVLPTGKDIKLSAGETYTGHITIVNPANSTQTLKYSVSAAPYSVTDENYSVDLSATTGRTTITEWIKIKEPEGELQPNESKDIEYTITVPGDAPAGGQYAALIVTNSPDQESSSSDLTISSVYEIASLIYANVSGKTVHDGTIIENNVPSFVTRTPVEINATLKNDGNTHEYASFSIIATNALSGEELFSTESEDQTPFYEVVMPETTRFVTRQIDNLPSLGLIRIKQSINYLGETSTKESNIFICPIWFLCLVALTIAAAVAFIISAIRKHHKK